MAGSRLTETVWPEGKTLNYCLPMAIVCGEWSSSLYLLFFAIFFLPSFLCCFALVILLPPAVAFSSSHWVLLSLFSLFSVSVFSLSSPSLSVSASLFSRSCWEHQARVCCSVGCVSLPRKQHANKELFRSESSFSGQLVAFSMGLYFVACLAHSSLFASSVCWGWYLGVLFLLFVVVVVCGCVLVRRDVVYSSRTRFSLNGINFSQICIQYFSTMGLACFCCWCFVRLKVGGGWIAEGEFVAVVDCFSNIFCHLFLTATGIVRM